MLRLAAIPIYLVAIVLCIAAARTAVRHRGPVSHTALWSGLATLYVLMIVSCLVDFEERWHASVRHLMNAGYGEGVRLFWQPLVAVLAIGFAASAAFLLMRRATPAMPANARRGLRLAEMAGSAFVLLVALRLISLHAIDAVLYGGPHINRVIDPGLTLLVAVGAWLFVKGVERR